MMRRLAVGLFCFSLAACSTPAPRSSSGGVLRRTDPESQGVSSAAILAFIDSADRMDAMNSVMIVRHGHVVAEGWWSPYDPDSNHELYSLSKSFTSTAVGFAISEGKLSLDDEVLKIFPEDAPPEPSANLKSMRIRDLLTMSAGHQDETSFAADKITPKAFLAHPVPHKPGTHFKYNTPATFMLSAAVQKRTGQTLLDYLKPRLFDPLGISKPVWNTNSQGIALGGYGLRVRTEDIARFGQLYLQRGIWEGKQLIPAGWVDLATSRQVSNGSNPKSDWEQGYGFQFWRCRHGAYRGDGAFGQYCVVLPEQDAVIAITSGLKDMQAVLNLIWDKLLPGLQPGALPEDRDSVARLRARLSGLKVKPVEGAATSPEAESVAGKKYVFPANESNLESLVFTPNRDGKDASLLLRVNGVESKVDCGFQDWRREKGNFGAYRDEPAAAMGAWGGEHTYIVKQVFYETPFYLTLTIQFMGAELSFVSETNVGFGATKKPALVGKRE
ncbi:MAG TPA: serine hydrolase [Planctomycetota bacterium]|nr:serine hydrolase [Planctomycetota bacterium]